MTDEAHWDIRALQARIADGPQRVRYPAGSPDNLETEKYIEYLGRHLHNAGKNPADADVVVLGMTPEIRLALHEFGYGVTCVDNSDQAIELFRDWIPPAYRQRETIKRSDWTAYASTAGKSIDAFLGDGVLANFPDVGSCRDLLCALFQALTPGGVCIFRLTSLPSRYIELPSLSHELIWQFRNNDLDPYEFGFAIRKFGFLDRAYDANKFILNNQLVFELIREMHRNSKLSEEEYAATQRYQFYGPNLLMPRDKLQTLIAECGFQVETHRLNGRHWYDYYSFYVCSKRSPTCTVGR